MGDGAVLLVLLLALVGLGLGLVVVQALEEGLPEGRLAVGEERGPPLAGHRRARQVPRAGQEPQDPHSDLLRQVLDARPRPGRGRGRGGGARMRLLVERRRQRRRVAVGRRAGHEVDVEGRLGGGGPAAVEREGQGELDVLVRLERDQIAGLCTHPFLVS